jgi:hypothetical protein
LQRQLWPFDSSCVFHNASCGARANGSVSFNACLVLSAEGGVGPGVLYVCGVPGTGKTACISEVMNNLRYGNNVRTN